MPQPSPAKLEFLLPETVVTPVGMSIGKADRPDLGEGVTEVRVTFLLGFPGPNGTMVPSEEFTVRLEGGQARELSTLLNGGIELAKATELPK